MQRGKAVEAMATVLVDLGAVPMADHSAQLVLLAEEAPPPGRGEEFGKASPVGLVVILLLAVATVLLIRNMSKRIRRLPASFDPPEKSPPEPAADHEDSPDGRSAQRAGRDGDDVGGARD